MRISDWSSDVCSSDLHDPGEPEARAEPVDAERAGDLEKDVPDIEKRRAEREYRFAHTEIARHRYLGETDVRAIDRADDHTEGDERHDAPQDAVEQIGRDTSELQSLMRKSYDDLCLKKKQQRSGK